MLRVESYDMFIISMTFLLIITLNSKLNLISFPVLVLILIFKHREIALIA